MTTATFYRCGANTSVYRTQKGMFKEFRDFEEANEAWETQDILSGFNLAPEVRSGVRRIRIPDHIDSRNKYRISGWGYYTEQAKLLTRHDPSCECIFCDNIWRSVENELEELCDNIENVTGRCFVDCHIGNVGYIERGGVKLLVCIDTGSASFDHWTDEEDL